MAWVFTIMNFGKRGFGYGLGVRFPGGFGGCLTVRERSAQKNGGKQMMGAHGKHTNRCDWNCMPAKVFGDGLGN
jgi:hypothetical protein